jgi:cytochrome c6
MIKFFATALLLVVVLACQSPSDEISRRAEAARQKAGTAAADSAPDGGAIFRKNCVTCHGTDGKLGLNGAKDLTRSELPAESRVAIITNGKNLMTPFKALLSPEEIQAVAAYTLTLKN